MTVESARLALEQKVLKLYPQAITLREVFCGELRSHAKEGYK